MRSSRPQIRNIEETEKTKNASRRKQARSWLILGAGAVGVASAVAKWAIQSLQASAVAAKNRALRDNLPDASLSQMEGTGTPVPLQGMPTSATPTNDARTFLVEPENRSILTESQAAPTVEPALTPKKTKSNKSATNTQGSTNEMDTTKTGSRKRSKMSEEYDQSLQANAMPTNGREREHLSWEMESASLINASGASAAPPEPASSTGSPAEQALSTQAEGKMAIGEELRDREFPVPPQETVSAPQKLVVDQETMTDNGPHEGGVIGAVSGDHQNKGVVGDIMDQSADTPDFAQQR